LNFISSAFAQTEAPAEHDAEHDAAGSSEAHGTATEAHGAEHHTFPPFDPATFGPQLFWLVILFGLLYVLMSKLALPRIGSILEERDRRIAGDLAEAARMKEASDAAVAAHEQALAEARQNAHAIGQQAHDQAKTEIAADRSRIEGELNGKLAAAEAEIANVKSRALADVDSIARDAVEAIVEALVGTKVGKAEVARAVEAAMAEGVLR
jgi:F-type H+-transporting ATPase subunit b